jgi:hypothetical protein
VSKRVAVTYRRLHRRGDREVDGDLVVSAGMKWLLVVAELALTVYAVTRVRRVVSEYRRLRAAERSPMDATREALREVLGVRLGGVLFTELSALWYAARLWRSEPEESPGGRHFAGHRRNSYPVVLGAFLILILIETSIAHLLLRQWSLTAAWVSTALGIYAGVWLMGDYHAARLNPSTATDHALTLNVGLRWHAVIAWPDVAGVHDRKPADRSQRMTLLGAPDFWLELERPVRVFGPFGIVRDVRAVGVGVDAPSQLRELIRERMSSNDRVPAEVPAGDR